MGRSIVTRQQKDDARRSGGVPRDRDPARCPWVGKAGEGKSVHHARAIPGFTHRHLSKTSSFGVCTENGRKDTMAKQSYRLGEQENCKGAQAK